MKLILSNNFITKMETPQYPLVMMWYSVCTITLPKFLDHYQEMFTQEFNSEDSEWSSVKDYFSELLTYKSTSGGNELSKLHKAKFLQDDNEESWISITLDPVLWSRRIHLVFIYAIDYFNYDNNLVDLSNNGMDFIRNIDNVSGVLLNTASIDDREVLVKASTNIIKLPIKLNCSYYSSFNGKYQQDQVDHYQSSILDRASLAKANNDQFIESYSGNNYARSQIATTYAIDLKGHMTIDSSGIIRL